MLTSSSHPNAIEVSSRRIQLRRASTSLVAVALIVATAGAWHLILGVALGAAR